jgi:hypothetical protein
MIFIYYCIKKYLLQLSLPYLISNKKESIMHPFRSMLKVGYPTWIFGKKTDIFDVTYNCSNKRIFFLKKNFILNLRRCFMKKQTHFSTHLNEINPMI